MTLRNKVRRILHARMMRLADEIHGAIESANLDDAAERAALLARIESLRTTVETIATVLPTSNVPVTTQ